MYYSNGPMPPIYYPSGIPVKNTASGIRMMNKIRLFGFSLAALVFCLTANVPCQVGDSDPILSYYCQRAAQAFAGQNPLQSGASFSFHSKSYYMNIGEHGEITRVDSGITVFYYSYGNLDSSDIIVKPEHDQKPVDLSYPDVFSEDYDFYFYPNDTGGALLAIGFDNYNADDTLPVGVAVIDRDRFFLRWLHLHYPNRAYHKRFSRSFRFTENEGYVFADSVWQVSAKRGVFTTEFFRTETGITDFRLNR